MTQILVELTFHSRGPWGEQLEQASSELARQLAASPGLVWQLWLENPESHRAGLLSLFANRGQAEEFVQQHRARLESFGVVELDTRLFAINQPLSLIGRCPTAMVGGEQ
ncbi:MAG: YdhR family protein [Corallincola sp.]|nr:YdhR family protein [Corallincola sp.]